MQVKNKKILYVKFYMLRIRGYCPHPAGAHSNHKGSSYHEWEGSLIFSIYITTTFFPLHQKNKKPFMPYNSLAPLRLLVLRFRPAVSFPPLPAPAMQRSL